jgi:hypothetical protein
MYSRLTVCGGAPGPLRAIVWERRVAVGRTMAERHFRKVLGAKQAQCASYRLSWRVRAAFDGAGVHSVVLHVRDALGRLSNAAARSYSRSA